MPAMLTLNKFLTQGYAGDPKKALESAEIYAL